MRRFRFQAVLLFLACYVGAVALVISSLGNTLTVGGGMGTVPIVIVDAGHGAFDGGAEGPGGTVEKDINLPIALKVRDLLHLYGFQVLMTREADVSTSDDGLGSLSERKTSDILNRFALIKAHPDSIFLSIHQNKFPDSSSRGAQMFYGPKSPQSEQIAGILQKNFAAMLQPGNTREPKKGEDSVYLLYYSPAPAVLVECGFLSNPEDEALLRTDAYQDKIAFVIAGSLLEYIEQGAFPQMEERPA